ncbi:MAG: lactate utilization protein C [Betaproteobacteria bacterium]|jgi:L-lactate dehydrogenase complex protein LldG|nr:lactate utilization protein C [Betaproteobacteria bacterium]NBO94536.1 lactate utilization protein C [Betaproteobacteria bacterium]NBP34681.1 lactate utilization protein C [Betaproteobacteria bacterium]NBP37423.1 lactate utilization protein C [Betaproteobacteria bacterium]NBQ78520.1 lactate utilization protein C [Betaproteobacteria bacterium]
MIPDTSIARQSILRRIRQAQGHGDPAKGSPADLVRRSERDAYLAEHPRGLGPSIGADVVDHFCTQAQRMASTVDRVPSESEVPQAMTRYLVDMDLSLRVAAWPGFSRIDFTTKPADLPALELEFRAPRGDDLVGLGGAFAGIAETGTLMLLSSAQTPASTHLLPETHIALLPVDRIVAHYEDAFALMRAEHAEPPRAMNLVSGPSRTADIEQTLVMGAHGPYRVHIILIG